MPDRIHEMHQEIKQDPTQKCPIVSRPKAPQRMHNKITTALEESVVIKVLTTLWVDCLTVGKENGPERG